MYATIIGFALAFMLIVVNQVAQQSSYLRQQSIHQMQQSGKLYMQRAANELTDQLGTAEEAIAAGGSTTSLSPGTTYARPATGNSGDTVFCPTSSNANATCAYQMTWSGTIEGSTVAAGVGESNESSSNVNSDIDEQRISALLTVTAKNATGATVYTASETVTERVYGFSPYASIVSVTNAKDSYAGSWDTVAAAEGDTAGCAGTTCGANTEIQSYNECQTDPSQSIPVSIQTQWCNANALNTSYNHTITAPDNTYQSTSSFSTQNWHNAGTTATQ
jgi:hypothetical protein